MKLAEALAERSDKQKRLQQVMHRAQATARYQEGETPAEDVNALLEEGLRLANQIRDLIVAINRTNSQVHVIVPAGIAHAQEERTMTITAAIALRDQLQAQRKLVSEVTEAAAGGRGLFGYRKSRTELIDKTDLDVASRRHEADQYAMWHRQVDTLIQQANWITELM